MKAHLAEIIQELLHLSDYYHKHNLPTTPSEERNEKLWGSLSTPCISKCCSYLTSQLLQWQHQEGPCSSVGCTHSTACALRWVGRHGEDELATPPPKPRLFPDSRGWGVILMFVILFHRKIAMCGVFFSFFLNAHLVWAVMQEIWGANIWCEEGLKSPAGGGGVFLAITFLSERFEWGMLTCTENHSQDTGTQGWKLGWCRGGASPPHSAPLMPLFPIPGILILSWFLHSPPSQQPRNASPENSSAGQTWWYTWCCRDRTGTYPGHI